MVLMMECSENHGSSSLAGEVLGLSWVGWQFLTLTAPTTGHCLATDGHRGCARAGRLGWERVAVHSWGALPLHKGVDAFTLAFLVLGHLLFM
jgi:hypothetical protein